MYLKALIICSPFTIHYQLHRPALLPLAWVWKMWPGQKCPAKTMLVELNKTSWVLYISLLRLVDVTRSLFSFAIEITDGCLPHMAIKAVFLKYLLLGLRRPSDKFILTNMTNNVKCVMLLWIWHMCSHWIQQLRHLPVLALLYSSWLLQYGFAILQILRLQHRGVCMNIFAGQEGFLAGDIYFGTVT